MTRNPNKVVLIFALILGAYAIGFWLYNPAEPALTFAAATEQEPAARVSDLDRIAEPNDEPQTAETPQTPVLVSTVPGAVRVIPPEFDEYIVKQGDTSFAVISRRLYGTSRHADAISRSNPFTSPAKLRVGQRLKVPVDPQNIQGRLERVEERVEQKITPASIPSLLDQPATATATAPAAPRVHVVRKGETLSDIAKLYYGSAARWRPILDANSGTLSRPERIKVGMELVIPD